MYGGYTLYEEQRQDGTIPRKVLAIHDGEFAKQKSDPTYQPATFEFRNPRYLEHERNKRAASSRMGNPNYGLDEVQAAIATLPDAKKQDDQNLLPPSQIPSCLNLVSVHSTRSRKPAEMSPDEFQAWLDQTRRTHFAPVQPRLQRQQQPVRALPYIPPHIWNLVNEIKALPRNSRSNMPMRKELGAWRFTQHFLNSGLLRKNSPLASYAGDTRLFSEEEWDFLTSRRK